MKFQYYWDHGIWRSSSQGLDSTELLGADMGSPADIQKMIQRAQRAQGLTDRAAKSGEGAETVMNNFEQTMERFEAHFGAMSEYDKQIQAMLGAQSNGGPPLDTTFPSTSAHATTGSTMAHPIDHATGDPLKK